MTWGLAGLAGKEPDRCLAMGLPSGVQKQGARIVLAARETVVPVRVGREGLGTSYIPPVL